MEECQPQRSCRLHTRGCWETRKGLTRANGACRQPVKLARYSHNHRMAIEGRWRGLCVYDRTAGLSAEEGGLLHMVGAVGRLSVK